MLFLILSLSLFSSAVAAEDIILKALSSKSAFTSLLRSNINTFHKGYSQSEMGLRARTFRKTLVEVAECNENAAFNCDLNQFSAMTEQEKSQYLGLANLTASFPKVTRQGLRLSAGPSVPAKDWRKLGAVTAVKNQKSCGSCWAFSATATIEGAYAITAGRLKSFSDQELLECTYENNGYNGCNGGWYYDSFEYLKRGKHLSTDKTLPYQAYDGACRNRYENGMSAAEVTGYVHSDNDANSVAAAIEISPVSIAMFSGGNFFSYSNGLYEGYYDCRGQPWANHALSAVAFTRNSFVIKNSWGSSWGDHGYIAVNRHSDSCFVRDYVMYPTMKKTGDDTSPTDSPNPGPKPQPDDKCKEQDYDANCVDSNSRDCPGLALKNRCYDDYMIQYTFTYCQKSCRFCNNIPMHDLASDCDKRIYEQTCGNTNVKRVCPKSCCDQDDGNDDGDNDGCPSGTKMCPDGTCKHEHMC